MKSAILPFALIIGFTTGCAERATSPLHEDHSAATSSGDGGGGGGAPDSNVLTAMISAVNERFAAEGLDLALAKVEFSLAPSAEPHAQTTVFASDRELRLETRWVPGDGRRLADGNNITQASFTGLGLMNATGAGNALGAIDRSFDTWNAVPCMNANIVKRTLPPGVFPSLLLTAQGFVSNPFAADISTIGFLPGSFFDAVLGPGASTTVLGVTFTVIFTSGGVPTDIDGDGRNDTALKEVWYNNNFIWTLTGAGGTDVETVALHENGHALEMGHFGRVAVNPAGKFVVSPRAVMNAFIIGTLRTPLGTDNAATCSNFADWPQ